MFLDRILVGSVINYRYVSEAESEKDFFLAVESCHPRQSASRALIRSAYEDVKHASAGWFHDGKPYAEHLRIVAKTGIFLGLDAAEQILTSLHHDTRENFLDNIPWDVFQKRYGGRVAWNVTALSRDGFPTTAEEIALADERYAARFRSLLYTDRQWLILVKLLDRLHNMKSYLSFYAGSEERYKRKLDETITVFVPLADRIGYGNVFRFFIKQWLGVEVPEPALR